ncbi:MAG: hypothetical protein SFT68_02780, partial [Rickettsiaceae bacterium]|nr:hypothetical protein [Rickettsiaceae bacterium]
NIIAEADLTKLDFLVNSIALEKKMGIKAKFRLKNLDSSDDNKFAFDLTGYNGLSINGEFIQSNSSNKISFKEIKYHNGNFAALIDVDQKNTRILLQGDLLDLSSANLENFFKHNKSGQSYLKLNIDLNKIKMKNNVNLTNVLVDMEYSQNTWVTTKMFAKIDGEDFISIEMSQEDKNYNLTTNRVDKLFALLSITNKIKSGVLTGFISFAGNHQHHGPLEGSFNISNMTMKNNKFIAKLVSFISMPGLLNALANSDIPFSRIKGDIYVSPRMDKILFKKVDATGAYFNFYAQAAIDTNARIVDVKGGVIPSLYGINNLIGGLPVIKYLFGNKGGAVITPFSYKETF